jgi:hypothetical protein
MLPSTSDAPKASSARSGNLRQRRRVPGNLIARGVPIPKAARGRRTGSSPQAPGTGIVSFALPIPTSI